MIPLIKTLRSRFQTEQAAAETNWTSLIEKVADGTANETETAKILKASGKSLDKEYSFD